MLRLVARCVRVVLWVRQPFEEIEERRIQLLQPGETQLHLGLDGRRSHDTASRGVRKEIVEQRGLPTPASPRTTRTPLARLAHVR